jgi:hypothetical protein
MPEGFCTSRTADPIIIQFELPAGWWPNLGLAKAALASSTLSPDLVPAFSPCIFLIVLLGRIAKVSEAGA